MSTEKYDKIKRSRYRAQINDRNDCSVVSIALACRVSYKEAHLECWEHGRKNRHGMLTPDILEVARDLGFHVIPVARMVQSNGSKYTPKTIGQKLKAGYYLVFCRGHVFTVINGAVHDWTQGREHHITSAYKIVRKSKDISLDIF